MNRFEKVTNILLDSFLSGSLAKGDCCKCAVGSIVKSCNNLGSEYNIKNLKIDPIREKYINWSLLFCSGKKTHSARIKGILKDYPFIETQIENTDYSIDELAEVERIFESNTSIDYRYYSSKSKQVVAEDQLKGLTCVLNYLSTLEEKTPVNYMEKFKTHKDLILV